MTLVLSFKMIFLSIFVYLCAHHSPAVFQIIEKQATLQFIKVEIMYFLELWTKAA